MPRLPHVCELCLLIRLWQLVALAPFRLRPRREGARCQRLLTSCAIIHWLILLAVTPFVLSQSSYMYEATHVKHFRLFKYIAVGTIGVDMVISLTLLLAHIWQRQKVARLVNSLAAIYRRSKLSWSARLLLWAKLLVSLYEVLCSVPFLTASRLPWSQLLAYGVQLYIQHISSVYANGVFAALILLLSYLDDLAGDSTLTHLLRRERHWLQVCGQFISTFQLGIFLLVIGSFINILANMYAYMSYFVLQHGVPLTISNYCLIVTIQLYALIWVAHNCQVRHARLRQRCQQLGHVPADLTQEQAMQPTSPLLMSPLGSLKFSILGLFHLDHAFWLFLVSYAVNFIVIILQFTLKHMKR